MILLVVAMLLILALFLGGLRRHRQLFKEWDEEVEAERLKLSWHRYKRERKEIGK